MADKNYLRTGTGYYTNSTPALSTDLELEALLADLFGDVTKGDNGADGVDGKSILHGAVDPTTEGVDGDFYINTVSNKIFLNTSGTWGVGVSLVGAAGADGATVDVADNFADDGAAATGGVAIGELYHNAGAVRIRLV